MAKHIAYLVDAGGSTTNLWLDTEHPLSSYGIGVLIVGSDPEDGWILSGLQFTYGKQIEYFPGMRERVYNALGLPLDDSHVAHRIVGGYWRCSTCGAKLTAPQEQFFGRCQTCINGNKSSASKEV